MDTAYLNNGNIYHTPQDNIDFISDGTIVNTLRNVATLVTEIQSDAKRIGTVGHERQFEESSSVFFTFPFLFFINYSGTVAIYLHSLVAVSGMLYAYSSKSLSYEVVMREVLAMIMSLLIGILWGIVVSIVCPMRWYANGALIVGILFIGPFLLAFLHIRRQSLKKSNLIIEQPSYSALPLEDNNSDLAHDAAYLYSCRTSAALIFIWSVVLAVTVMLRIMSGYVAGDSHHNNLCIYEPITPVGIFVICAVVGDWMFRYCRHRATKVAAVYVYFVCLAPALLHWLELFHGFLLMLLPLLGKIGTLVPPDIVGTFHCFS